MRTGAAVALFAGVCIIGAAMVRSSLNHKAAMSSHLRHAQVLASLPALKVTNNAPTVSATLPAADLRTVKDTLARLEFAVGDLADRQLDTTAVQTLLTELAAAAVSRQRSQAEITGLQARISELEREAASQARGEADVVAMQARINELERAALQASQAVPPAPTVVSSEPDWASTLGQRTLALAFNDESFRFTKVNLTDMPVQWASGTTNPVDLSFFFVNNEDGMSDNMLTFLREFEAHVISYFYHILATKPCEEAVHKDGDFGCWRRHPLGVAAIQRGATIKTLDVGSNSGFYSMFMASLGYDVVSFDPQPQCSLFVTAAAAMNGFTPRQVQINNAFATNGDGGSTEVSSRTGCFGTFPLLAEAEEMVLDKIRAKSNVPEDRLVVQVPHVRIDGIIPADTFIPFMKVDVEGHEPEVLDSVDTLLREQRILTIMMEANKNTWAKTGRSMEFMADMFAKLVRYGYTFKPNSDGPYFVTPARDWASPGVILEWLNEGWLVADIIVYVPV